jgi:hypothetical protein
VYIHHAKSLKFATVFIPQATRKTAIYKKLQKPEGYLFFDDKYKLLLMQYYLSDETKQFTDDDW